MTEIPEEQEPVEGAPPALDDTIFNVPRPEAVATSQTPHPLQVEVLGGPMDGLDRKIEGSRMEIGRSTENDLPLPMDGSVSSHHAQIVREGRTHWLEDLDSRNGTFLGEARITDRLPITPGATFRVGRTLLQFMPRR